MFRRKFIAGAMMCALLFAPCSASAQTFSHYTDNGVMCSEMSMPVTIHADGNYVYSDVEPVIVNGRTMVPLRAAGETIGAEVDWDQATQTATASRSGKTATFALNNKTYYVDGEAHTTDVAPSIVDNRTMLPIRVFSEALGVKVEWNQDIYAVDIDTEKEDAKIPELPDGASNDAKRMLKKYYVQPSKAQPFAPFAGNYYASTPYPFGTGLSNYVREENLLIMGDSYHDATFVSITEDTNLNNKTIIAYNADIRAHSYWGDGTTPASLIIEYGNPSYYRGPNTGFTSTVRYTLSYRDGNLLHVRTEFLPQGTTQQTNNELFEKLQ